MVNLSSVYDNALKLTLPGAGYTVHEMGGTYPSGSMIAATLKPGSALFIKED